jgi:hypothetical protein
LLVVSALCSPLDVVLLDPASVLPELPSLLVEVAADLLKESPVKEAISVSVSSSNELSSSPLDVNSTS